MERADIKEHRRSICMDHGILHRLWTARSFHKWVVLGR